MELLFRRTDFHPPLLCQKGIKYSLKAEYSYIVTSDLSHVPVGFKGICHWRSSERDATRKSADIYIYTFFLSGCWNLCLYGLSEFLNLLLPWKRATLQAVAKTLP